MSLGFMADLGKLQAKAAPKSLGSREENVIGKVVSHNFDRKAIEIEVMNGTLEGETIFVRPTRTGEHNHFHRLTNEKDTDRTSSYSPEGSFVRVDGLKFNADEDRYESGYMVKWVGRDKLENHDLIQGASVNIKKTRGTFRNANASIYVATMMFPETEKPLSSFADMKAFAKEAFEAGRNALVYELDPETQELSSQEVQLAFREQKNERGETIRVPLSADETLDALFGGVTPEQEKIYDEQQFAVKRMAAVQVESTVIGVKSAMNIDNAITKARQMNEKATGLPMNPERYKNPSLGERLEGAFKAKNYDADGEPFISKDRAERFRDMFMQWAPDELKMKRQMNGWKGVPDDDLRAFFKANDIDFPAAPFTGWQTANVLLQRHSSGTGRSLIKSQEKDWEPWPYPKLNICKELAEGHRMAMIKAVGQVADPEFSAAFAKSLPEMKQDQAVDAAAIAQRVEEQEAAENEAQASLDSAFNELDGALDGAFEDFPS